MARYAAEQADAARWDDDHLLHFMQAVQDSTLQRMQNETARLNLNLQMAQVQQERLNTFLQSLATGFAAAAAQRQVPASYAPARCWATETGRYNRGAGVYSGTTHISCQ